MSPHLGEIALRLTLEEAQELFTLCLSSMEADSQSSVTAMRKLGEAIEVATRLTRKAS